MTPDRENHYRKALEQLQDALQAEDETAQGNDATVSLDQQSVGRLSRMDALQGQSMALARTRRRAQMGTRIAAALVRMDEGEFGYCLNCGDEIAPARLDADPTIPTCISCAKA